MNKVTDNIEKSSTLPSEFYFDDTIWEQMKENVFATTWQYD